MSVPANAEISVEMKADNWGFGRVQGTPRDAKLSARPAGSDKPTQGI
ncbi:MAG: hypothetical protein IT454_17730 [Planctomycetes bacterium]|nr:hypothetical protein [Planctomycetota bacterium]